MAESLLAFNPFTVWISRARKEREAACDRIGAEVALVLTASALGPSWSPDGSDAWARVGRGGRIAVVRLETSDTPWGAAGAPGWIPPFRP